MVLSSNESTSSDSSSTSSRNLSNDYIISKIKQAYSRQTCRLKDDQKNKLPVKTLKPNLARHGNKASSCLSSAINKTNLIKRSILQEKLCSQQLRSGSRSNLPIYRERNASTLDTDNRHRDNSKECVLQLKKPLINKENESIYYDNCGEMGPINWSFIRENESKSKDMEDFLSNELEQEQIFSKDMLKNIPEPNPDFVNFVNNCITPDTVYTVEGNIKQDFGTFELPEFDLEKTKNDIKIINRTLDKDVIDAFKPRIKQPGLMDLIDSPNGRSIFSQNEKIQLNAKSDDKEVKAANMNNLQEKELEKEIINYKAKSKITENFLPPIYDKNAEEMSDNDMFTFVEAPTVKSLVHTNDNEKKFTLKKRINSENRNAPLYYKLKQIFKSNSITSDLDEQSQVNNDLKNLSLDVSENQDNMQLKKSDLKMTVKQEFNDETVDINSNNTKLKKCNSDPKTLRSDADSDESESNHLKSTSNETPLKIKQSMYFQKLLNFSNNIDNSKANQNNETSDTDMVSHDLAIVSNLREDDVSDCTENSNISITNNSDNHLTPVKNINDKDEANIEINESHSRLSSRNSLSSVDDEEEFDFVNFSSYQPFIDLVNNVRDMILPQKPVNDDMGPNLDNKNNNGLTDNIKSPKDLKSHNSSENLDNSDIFKTDSLSNSDADNEISSSSSDASNQFTSSKNIVNEDNNNNSYLSYSEFQHLNHSNIPKMSDKRNRIIEIFNRHLNNITEDKKDVDEVEVEIPKDERQTSLEVAKSNCKIQIIEQIKLKKLHLNCKLPSFKVLQ